MTRAAVWSLSTWMWKNPNAKDAFEHLPRAAGPGHLSEGKRISKIFDRDSKWTWEKAVIAMAHCFFLADYSETWLSDTKTKDPLKEYPFAGTIASKGNICR